MLGRRNAEADGVFGLSVKGVGSYALIFTSLATRAVDIGKRRVVKDNPEISVRIFFETPGLIDRRHLSVFVCEVDLAHRDRHVAIDEHAGIVDLYAAPTFEGETVVVRESLVAAREISQRAFSCRAESLLAGGQRRLKEHGAIW
jgi:hypothetical protein